MYIYMKTNVIIITSLAYGQYTRNKIKTQYTRSSKWLRTR